MYSIRMTNLQDDTMIETFNNFYDALHFIDTHHEEEYFKVELLKLPNGSYRVGIIIEQQMELEV